MHVKCKCKLLTLSLINSAEPTTSKKNARYKPSYLLLRYTFGVCNDSNLNESPSATSACLRVHDVGSATFVCVSVDCSSKINLENQGLHCA